MCTYIYIYIYIYIHIYIYIYIYIYIHQIQDGLGEFAAVLRDALVRVVDATAVELEPVVPFAWFTHTHSHQADSSQAKDLILTMAIHSQTYYCSTQ